MTRGELLEQLTMAGLEVDGTTAVAGDFSGVIVAEIVSVARHPNADKLTVCQVSDGAGTYQVVCGAPNVRPGLIGAFAPVGATLPDNLKIAKVNLRDVESNGMLCSMAELELGDDRDRIIELDLTDRVGEDLRKVLLLDDVTIDLDLTPNRGDCLSVRGLAREVGVLNNLSVETREVMAVDAVIDDTFAVELEDSIGCPRYLGRVIRGVDASRPSPLWLTEKLRRGGLRSIDPIVDVTNFVMLELGQPLHAFDLKRLADKIVVRRARSEEVLTLFDGQQVELDETVLLITDGNGPVAMAGVMGGERSGVQADTTDIFLESAFFSVLAIAGTARRYGLHTDASHRYERGVDFNLQRTAIERATQLLLDIVGGQPGPVTEVVDSNTLPVAPVVSVRQTRLNTLVGTQIDAGEVDEAMQRLDFEVLNRDEGPEGVTWTIEAPSHRFDISCEADLVEEVCRIFGYDNIPIRRPVTDLKLRRVPRQRLPASELKIQLASMGYHEAISYSFVDPKLQDLLAPGVDALALANPMSAEQSVMRVNLLPGLIDALRFNVARQQDRLRLFELGLSFTPGDVVDQKLMLGGLLWGKRFPESWNQPADDVDFFDLKGDVERLIGWVGEQVHYEKRTDPVLHPGQAGSVLLHSEIVGRFGRLHPEIERALDVAGAVFVFELDGAVALRRAKHRHRRLSRYPSVRRDLAVVLNEEVTAAQVESILRKSLGEVLVDFRLFDVYQGKGIDSNEKSLGVGLTLQDPSATLTEEDIGNYTGKAVDALARGVGARLR
ncbi:MAG: phenylalanine--tRNA ligase subunit beta [Gammaproteobacteria bacterium]|nr:phenylalanine--tRNA ligase subunit beta [Gammaproteobacteria bacterium]